MYVCLTNRCHGRCDYCPEQKWFSANSLRAVQDMSVEMFEKILSLWDGVPANEKDGLELCGGEVLLYPQLGRVLEEARQKNFHITLQTSLMVDGAYMDYFMSSFRGYIDCWEINLDCSYEDFDRFIGNLWKVVNNGYFELYCTLRNDEDSVDKEFERIAHVLGTFDGDNRPKIFIQTAVAPMESKSVYDFTEDIKALVDKVTERFPTVNFIIRQCTGFCEVNKEKLSEINNLRIIFKTSYCSIDHSIIMPDGSYRFCLPFPKIIVDNVAVIGTAGELEKERERFYELMFRNMYMPDMCRECEYLNPGKCFSLCFAKLFL